MTAVVKYLITLSTLTLKAVKSDSVVDSSVQHQPVRQVVQ